jgi:hypothetical protein
VKKRFFCIVLYGWIRCKLCTLYRDNKVFNKVLKSSVWRFGGRCTWPTARTTRKLRELPNQLFAFLLSLHSLLFALLLIWSIEFCDHKCSPKFNWVFLELWLCNTWLLKLVVCNCLNNLTTIHCLNSIYHHSIYHHTNGCKVDYRSGGLPRTRKSFEKHIV